MSIVVKKKPKYYRKKILQRIFVLVAIYFISFFTLNAIFGEKILPPAEIKYANDGERFIAEAKYPEAMEYFLAELEKNKEDYIAMNRLGCIYKHLKQYDKAKFYLYKSKILAPNYVDNYVQAVSVYTAEGNFAVAERIIDIMPVKTKKDFLEKANAMTNFADKIPNKEDKILYYNRALKYYKKYDTALYAQNVDKLVLLYFDVAAYYISQGDIQSAEALYDSANKLKDDCKTNNLLAEKYIGINRNIKALNYVKKAVSQAKTQEERRETLKVLINIRNYFENIGDNNLLKITKDYIKILDDEAILVDEKYSRFAIVDDELEFKNQAAAQIPIVKFKIKNQSEEEINSLQVKLEASKNSSHIIYSETVDVKLHKNILKPKQTTSIQIIELSETIPTKELKDYSFALSISTNGKNWNLYRLYNVNQ